MDGNLFLDALACRNVSRPPVWIMRQAGRYLPQYQEFRKKYALTELFSHPDLAAEITLLPIDAIGMDAAILFSDILTIVKGFGFGLDFVEKKGPQIFPRITSAAQIQALPSFDLEKVRHVQKTITLLKETLLVPLIGFAGGPFTVASYIFGGVSEVKAFLYNYPQEMHLLLQKLTEATISYLQMQVAAGANALQLFDSWAGMLPLEEFNKFSLHYLKQIVESLKKLVPVIVFARGSSLFAEELAEIGPSCISMDFQVPMKDLRKKVPKHIALQGNLDPELLLAPEDIVRQKTKALLDAMAGEPGFIVNLGHGVLPATLVENVKAMVDTVKSYQPMASSSWTATI